MLGNRFKIFQFLVFFIFVVANGQITINDSSLSVKDESCFDANDGEINGLTASGGFGVLTYKWTYTGSGSFDINQQGSLNISGLSPGDYSLIATDQNQVSSAPYLVTIIEKTAKIEVTDAAPATQNLLCFGDTDGKIWVYPAPYPSILQIDWYLNGLLVSSWKDKASISDLGVGKYKIVIIDTDSPTCFIEKSFEIIQPAVITATAVQNNPVKCKGESNGEATVTATGGTGQYTYLWDTGATTAKASNLAAGEHTVTVTDANGCTNANPIKVTIEEPPIDLGAELTIIDIKCKGDNDGQATVRATGGTPGYTYLWDTGATTATASNLMPGAHSVTIKDANGCNIIKDFVIKEPLNKLVGTETKNTSVSCYGGSDGYAQVNFSGGTPPYIKYSWGVSSASTTNEANDLTAGFHTITATDSNGCEASIDIIINGPSEIIAEAKQLKSVTCFGEANGSAGVIVSGGAGFYTYSWDGGSFTTSNTANNLAVGEHTIVIKDANGCTNQDPVKVMITEPDVIKATAVQVSQVLCKGEANGVATVTATGGTGKYTYSWDNSAFTTSSTASNLTAGEHIVIVKDANGCMNPDPVKVTIFEPANELTGSITATLPVKCNGESNGEATVTPSGGTSPYTYSWDNSTATSLNKVTNLNAGSHTVIIIDANGCQKLIPFTITEPNALSASAIEDNPVKCTGYFNGKATVTVYGGTAPYSYSWDKSTSKDPTASDLGAGLHKITIRDANNCETTTTVTINELISLTATTEQIQPVSCNGKSDGSAKVTPTGGTAPYLYSWDNAAFTSSFTANNLAAGTHTIIIRDANNCELTTTVLITEPPILSATAAPVSPVKCKGESNGSATVTPTGGVAPYTFIWDKSTSTSATASNLMAGLHTITITDKNGCKAQTTVTITEPNALALTANIVPIICDKGGSITVQVTGGVSTNYFYTWTGPSSFAQSGANLRSVTNLLNGGTYKLTVTDDNGCAIVRYFTLEAYVPLQYTGPTAIEFDTCNSNPTFGINVVDIRGGIPYTDGNGNPYYYFEWFGPNNYHSNEAIIPIIPGNYVGIIIDSQNCRSAPINFTVTTPYTPIVVTETIGNVSCDATNNDGYIAVAINGGNIPYNIVWEREIPSTTTGNSNPTYSIIGQNILRVNNLMEGRYRLTVKSNLFGCSDSNPAYKFQTIYTVKTQNSIRILEAPVLDSSLCGGNKGTLTVKVIDDNNGPVSFYYNDELATANNLGGNEYLVYIDNFVTDGLLNIVNEFGCGETVIIDIKVAEPSFDISSVGYNLNGVININESVTFSNTSTQPYTRLEWDFGDNSDLSEEESPVHVYVVSGIRDVTLRIYNDLGCYKEYTEKISVGKGFLAMFPDIFTPNNDGINDYFQGELVGFESFEFEIYDLWNNLLFATATDVISNNNWGWDGYLSDGTVFNGKVFKYVFKGIDNFGKEIIVSNQAILLR